MTDLPAKLTNKVLHRFNLHVARWSFIQDTMRIAQRQKCALEFVKALDFEKAAIILPWIDKSRAQLHQDLFALASANGKSNGFFVEFGATNGIELSNTWLLEAEFGWTGILAEPAKCWHQNLEANRSARIEKRCVWSETGEALEFAEASLPVLSTLIDFKDKDQHSAARENASTYFVETVSLNDMLLQHGAPTFIDYLSIDTEGSELSILKNFDFSLHRFGCITVEHNFTQDREEIKHLLGKNGYLRVLTEVSRFDDWYIAVN